MTKILKKDSIYFEHTSSVHSYGITNITELQLEIENHIYTMLNHWDVSFSHSMTWMPLGTRQSCVKISHWHIESYYARSIKILTRFFYSSARSINRLAQDSVSLTNQPWMIIWLNVQKVRELKKVFHLPLPSLRFIREGINERFWREESNQVCVFKLKLICGVRVSVLNLWTYESTVLAQEPGWMIAREAVYHKLDACKSFHFVKDGKRK